MKLVKKGGLDLSVGKVLEMGGIISFHFLILYSHSCHSSQRDIEGSQRQNNNAMLCRIIPKEIGFESKITEKSFFKSDDQQTS